MKYIVDLYINGEKFAKNIKVTADSPKKAGLKAVNRYIRLKKFDMIEARVCNIEGNLWHFLFHLDHDNRKVNVVREKKLR